jgi:hypothetical protein
MVSYNRVTMSGSTNLLSVTYPYLDKTHVIPYLDGVALSPGAYTWQTDSQIAITAGNPAAGTVGETRRRTPADPLTTFTPGNLDVSDLNVAALQPLFLAEEARDASDDYGLRGWVTSNLGIGGEITKGAAGQLAVFDAEGNIKGTATIPSEGTGVGLMLASAYDPTGRGSDVFNQLNLPIMPSVFGALGTGLLDDTLALQAAIDAAVAQKRTLLLSPGYTYLFSQLNFPAGLVVAGTGKLRYNGLLPGTDTWPFTIGEGASFDTFDLSTPGTEVNVDLGRIAKGVRFGKMRVVSDVQRAGGGIRWQDPNDIFVGHAEFVNIDRPVHLENLSTTVQAEGAYIGFLDIDGYVRGFRSDFTKFFVAGSRMSRRSVNAGKNPGHNGALILGGKGWYFGDHIIEDAGEHAIRLSTINLAVATIEDYTIGKGEYRRCGGSGFKVNPTFLVSPGVTEKAKNGHHAGYIAVDCGDGTVQGNEEIGRITHVDGLTIGYAMGYTDNETQSGQYALQINDAKNVTIGRMGGTALNAGFVTIDGTSDVDGINTFGGDVIGLRIAGVVGACVGNNAIAVNTAFQVGDVDINLDGISGFAALLLRWDAGTLLGKFNISGSVFGTVPPAVGGSAVPASDAVQINVQYFNQRAVGRADKLRFGAAFELTPPVFDPSSTTAGPTGLSLNNGKATAGQGNYGGALEFTRLGGSRRGAAIAPKQITTDDKEVSLSFCVGDSNTTGNEALLEKMILKYTGTLYLASLATYANNAAAITGGLVVGDVYKASTGEVRIVV